MEKILDYLLKDLSQPNLVASIILEKFKRNPDIAEELEKWIETKKFPPANTAVSVESYTAEEISRLAPFMDGLGTYNFLITLRERPEVGKQILANNFAHRTVVTGIKEKTSALKSIIEERTNELSKARA